MEIVMAGYNLPADVSPTSPEAPWNKPYREIPDEYEIHEAVRAVDELEASLLYLDRNKKPWSHFMGVGRNPYKALDLLREDLRRMLGEEE